MASGALQVSCLGQRRQAEPAATTRLYVDTRPGQSWSQDATGPGHALEAKNGQSRLPPSLPGPLTFAVDTDSMYMQPNNLTDSGIDLVLCTTLFAIVGAVSLQHGGEVASRVAREKVLGRMRSGN